TWVSPHARLGPPDLNDPVPPFQGRELAADEHERDPAFRLGFEVAGRFDAARPHINPRTRHRQMSRPESVDVTGAGAPPRLRIAHSRASAERRSSGSWLRRVLQLLDLCSVMFAWTVTMLLGSGVTTSTLGKAASAVLAAGAAGLVAIAAQHLYLSRVSAVRAVELIRLSRAAIFSGVVAYFVADQVGLAITVPTAVVGSAIAFVMLACCRSLYDGWLKAARGAGRFARPVVIIGSNDEASELCRLLETHPEVGLRAVGVV